MKIASVLTVAISLALACSTLGRAEPITVPGFSFQNTVPAQGWQQGTTPTGWTFSAGLSSRFGYQTHAVAGMTDTIYTDSTQHAYIITVSNESNHMTSAAPLGDGVKADTIYTLTVALGNRNLVSGGTSYSPYQYTLSIVVGAEVVSSFSLANASYAIPGHSFRDYSVTFDSSTRPDLINGDLKVRIGHTYGFNVNPQTGTPDTLAGTQGLFDNVRLTATPIPEPSSCLLMSLSLLGVAAICRRRQNDE